MQVSKSFGETVAVNGVLFDAAPGEVVAVTGPSGAGKSTICRLVAGFEIPDAGYIELGGRNITRQPPGARGVAYMFESYALYPHLSVFENAASPLRATAGNSGLSESHIRARVMAALEFLDIDQLAERLPNQLSGGQRQRVALARALSQEPHALLLDEPISHLDAKLRHRLRAEIKRRLTQRDAPVVWCTPDGLEALSVGNRVVVLIGGCIEQIGTPDEIWSTPRTTRVARLIGDPPMNLLSGRVTAANGGAVLETASTAIPLREGDLFQVRPGTHLTIGIRADALDLGETSVDGALPAEIYAVEPFGKWAIVTARLAGELVKLKVAELPHLAPGAAVGLVVRDSQWTLFDAATGVALPNHRNAAM
jgi:ABC-type sugar transport system ATPase subunit